MDTAQIDYWREALIDSFDQTDEFGRIRELSEEQLCAIAKCLAQWADSRDQAFYQPEPPPNFEARDLQRQLDELRGRADREREAALGVIARKLGVDPREISFGDYGEVLYHGGGGLPYEIG